MKNCLLIALFSLCHTLLSAQHGTISGKVVDEVSGEDLAGAVVQIELAGLGTATDLSGNYTLKNVPVGTHDLTISYISYQSKKVTGVVVVDGKTTTADIVLNSAPLEVGTVQVTDYRTTNTEANLLLEMKDAQGVMSGMSGRQIAKSQDTDAAAVAKRIPGVTIVDNRFVMVRGLQERYNAVMLNGALAPSLETDVKSFSFDLIPSGVIDRLLIYKSPSPDLPGEFAGGAINLITKNFPDKQFEVKAAYTPGFRQGTTGELFVNNAPGKNDWLGIGGKERALPNDFPENVRNISGNALETLGKSMPNTWAFSNDNAPLDTRANASVGKLFTFEKFRVGSITAINYNRTYQTINSTLTNYNVYDVANNISDTTETYTDSIYSNTNRLGLMQNFGLKSDKHELSFRNFFNQTGLAENTLRTGKNIQDGFNRKSYQYRYMERSLYTGQLSGTHAVFGKTGEFNWLLGYNAVKRSEPDIRRITYNQPLDDTSIPYQAQVTGNAQPFYFSRLFMDLTEKSTIESFSYQHYYNLFDADDEDNRKWASVKIGAYHQFKKREFSIRNIGYVQKNGFDQNLLTLPVDQILSEENINNAHGFRLDEMTKGSDKYTAQNNLMAWFAMVNLPMGKLNISGGVRVEDNTQKLFSETVQGGEVAVDKHVVSVLPSLNVSYNFTKEMLVRAAYGRTVNRPEFRELAPFAYYDFVQNFVVEGNTGLKVPSIMNYDLRWEFYPNPTEVISAGVFYKDFQNPIELSLDPTSTPWGVDPYNAVKSYSYGAEVDIRKSLKDLTEIDFLGNLSLVANASYVKSEVTIKNGESTTENTKPRTMMFQSPYVINGGIYFQDDSLDLSVNVLYNVIGPRLFLAGINGLPDVYDMPRNVIDLTITKGIGEHFDVRFGVQDILNQQTLLLQDANGLGGLDRDTDQRRQYFSRGTYFTLGIMYEFRK